MRKIKLLFAAAASFAIASAPVIGNDEEMNASSPEVKAGMKTDYDYDVKKNPITGTKTYEEEATGEAKVDGQVYKQKYKHKRKVSKDGKVLLDEEHSKTEAE